jgi:hypothetical protein
MVDVRNSALQNRESATAVILGVVPFLLPTLLVLFGPLLENLFQALGLDFNQTRIAGSFVAIFLALFFLGALLAGWIHGFPRWSYPYLGLVIVTSLMLSNASTPGLWLFGYDHGRQLWGRLAWLPLLVVAGTAVTANLIRGHKKRPFRLLANAWEDWTLLSFALYGTLILLPFVALDEIHSAWEKPVMALGGVLLAIGAYAYMRAASMKGRALALFAGFTVTFNFLVGFSTIYWESNGSAHFIPSGWPKAIANQIFFYCFYALFLFSPAIIGLLRYSTGKPRLA